MAKAGDKYVGELDFQRPDGEYDIWTIVKRLDPAVAGSRPKGYPIYLIGTATNSGLLSDYYYTPERGESESKSLEEISADLEVLARDGEKYMSRVRRIPKKGLRKNPPFYAHNLYEKKTHGLTLKQMRRLYAMVSRGNQKAITYARNVLGIPFSESPTQVKAVVYHHVRDLAERRVRRNPARSHRERIAIDTVRHPMKGYFLGGPDLAESVRYLRGLGYSMAQLKKLNPEVEDILAGRKSILPNRRKGPVTESEIRAMYRRHGVGLSQRGMFGKGYDAVSEYGYVMGKGPYKTAKEAERYVIKFYKKRPRLVRQ